MVMRGLLPPVVLINVLVPPGGSSGRKSAARPLQPLKALLARVAIWGRSTVARALLFWKTLGPVKVVAEGRLTVVRAHIPKAEKPMVVASGKFIDVRGQLAKAESPIDSIAAPPALFREVKCLKAGSEGVPPMTLVAASGRTRETIRGLPVLLALSGSKVPPKERPAPELWPPSVQAARSRAT
jgi:hypothetical protein